MIIHYWNFLVFLKSNSKTISTRLCLIAATSEHWKCKHSSILYRSSVQFVFVFETCCAAPPSTRQGNQFQNWFFHSKTTAAPWYKRNSVQRARNVKKRKNVLRYAITLLNFEILQADESQLCSQSNSNVVYRNSR